MKEDCDAEGVPFLVALLPRRDQVDGTLEATAYNTRIAAICGRHGIDMVDMLPPLAEAYVTKGKDLFIPWDGHNSASANRVIAGRLARELLPASTKPVDLSTEAESPFAPN